MIKIVNVNEYITRFKDIKPSLDELCESVFNERVLIENNGCNEYIVRKSAHYLENHGIIVTWKDIE